jgi:hypothetical protein
MLFEEPSPRLPGDKWGRGTKKTGKSAREHVRFGDHLLTVLRVWPCSSRRGRAKKPPPRRTACRWWLPCAHRCATPHHTSDASR